MDSAVLSWSSREESEQLWCTVLLSANIFRLRDYKTERKLPGFDFREAETSRWMINHFRFKFKYTHLITYHCKDKKANLMWLFFKPIKGSKKRIYPDLLVPIRRDVISGAMNSACCYVSVWQWSHHISFCALFKLCVMASIFFVDDQSVFASLPLWTKCFRFDIQGVQCMWSHAVCVVTDKSLCVVSVACEDKACVEKRNQREQLDPGGSGGDETQCNELEFCIIFLRMLVSDGVHSQNIWEVVTLCSEFMERPSCQAFIVSVSFHCTRKLNIFTSCWSIWGSEWSEAASTLLRPYFHTKIHNWKRTHAWRIACTEHVWTNRNAEFNSSVAAGKNNKANATQWPNQGAAMSVYSLVCKTPQFLPVHMTTQPEFSNQKTFSCIS